MTRITVRNNGPVRIEGEFELYDAEGRPFDLAGRTAISLCRCGHSEIKPFCDGKHKECGFSSEVRARTLEPLPAPGGATPATASPAVPTPEPPKA